MSRPDLTARLVVVAANIESVGKSPALANLVREHDPDVVIVEQAYNARRFLRSIGGYRLRQYRGQEASGIAVLVKHGVTIQGRRPLRMKQRWQGPPSKGGRWHNPRTYPSLRLLKGGVTFRVLGIHLPTFNNPAAQAESMTAVEEWFAHRPDVPSIAAGDWNREAHQLAALAQRCGGVVLNDNTKVDSAIAANGTGSSKRLPMPPGPHGWSKYVLTATKEN